jgi:beta-galactosidase
MVQVENEYGSFGRDRAYLSSLLKIYREAGFSETLYTVDSGGSDRPDVQKELAYGTLPGVYAAINFGQTQRLPGPLLELEKFRPGQPKMVGEYWVGWFDHWGGEHQLREAQEAATGLAWMLRHNVSFSLYMFHGGTNFGWMNGANWNKGVYEPDTTSYDYDAPLDEAGRPTAKFALLRELLASHLAPQEVLPPLPAPLPLMRIAPFTFEEAAPLEDLLGSPIFSPHPLTMEEIGQDYGYILYRYTPLTPLKGQLVLGGLRDYAVLMQQGKLLGTLDRRLTTASLPVALQAAAPLDILVENTGRLNYSAHLLQERKGITGPITLNEELKHFAIYALPLKELSGLRFKRGPVAGPGFYRATFSLKKRGDTFLDLKGFQKGMVFINGRPLGRFWNIGPQLSLYCPAPWLNQGLNEVLVFDLFSHDRAPQMSGRSEPRYLPKDN